MSRTSRASGFTLLEVLIAFLIASLAFGVIVAAASGALLTTRTAARYAEATVRAQSRLEETINGGSLMSGNWEGDDGAGYHWRVRVTQSMSALPHSSASAAMPMTLYAVTVWISWRDGTRTRELQLDTEQIGQVVRAP